MLPAIALAGPLPRVRVLSAILLGVLCLVTGLAPVPAQQPTNQDGLFITVPNPIRDDAVQQIKLKVRDALERQKRAIGTIVFDFNLDGQPNGSGNFGSCSDLADYIRNLTLGVAHPDRGRIKVVAFVHGPVTKHSVLPALACGEIVMSDRQAHDDGRSRARIGNVTRSLAEPLTPTARNTYRELAEQFASPDLVLRMLDPELPLQRVKTGNAILYLSPARIAEWRKENKIFTVEPAVPAGLEPGNAIFDARLAREVGLAGALIDTRADLADALKLSRHSLTEDWLVGKQPVAWRVDVTGVLNKGRVDSLRRRINSAVGRGANFLILNLDCEGGDTTHMAPLADDVRQLHDRTGGRPIKKVAYIPPGRSLGAACYLAVVCDEIVMGSNSALADFNYLAGEKADALYVRWKALQPFLVDPGYPAAPFEAAFTRNLALVRVRMPGGDVRLVTDDEFKREQDAGGAKRDVLGRITPGADDSFLRITAERAREWRIARETGIDSIESLYTYCGLDPERDTVRVSRDDVLDRIAEFFREPLVNFVLIMLGIIGLILELKMPGTTFPGAIAAICFVLFFWAYSFVGEFTLLAVLLFLLGLILIGVEIFLIPGLGFSGVAGVTLVIISLTLVTLERWPETTQDWAHLGSTVMLLAMSLVAAIVGAFTLTWFLPNIPYFNRLVLKPPTEDEDGQLDLSASGHVPASLLGAIGVAVTTLRPAGKAQFGDEFLDVIAEGDYVNPGSRVQVIELEGNRIVVKEV
jgi:membrane-bound serine protease (ClpP class)